jgi:hypothetical protein
LDTASSRIAAAMRPSVSRPADGRNATGDQTKRERQSRARGGAPRGLAALNPNVSILCEVPTLCVEVGNGCAVGRGPLLYAVSPLALSARALTLDGPALSGRISSPRRASVSRSLSSCKGLERCS